MNESVVVAVQLHHDDAVTDTVNVPPSRATELLVGEIVNVHGAASCVTVTSFPATVTDAVRAAPVFAAAVIVTAPFPCPFAPAAIVSHALFDCDTQKHAPDDAVTFTDCEAPLDAKLSVAGATEYVHPSL